MIKYYISWHEEETPSLVKVLQNIEKLNKNDINYIILNDSRIAVRPVQIFTVLDLLKVNIDTTYFEIFDQDFKLCNFIRVTSINLYLKQIIIEVIFMGTIHTLLVNDKPDITLFKKSGIALFERDTFNHRLNEIAEKLWKD